MDAKFLLFIVFLAVSFAFVLIAAQLPGNLLFIPFKIIFLLIAAVLDVMAVASRYYSYLLLPALKQRKRNIVLSSEEPYRLSPSGDSIIRKEADNSYIATTYVMIPLYRSATEMSSEEKLSFANQVSRLTTIMKSPVRFTAEMRVMNKDSYIATLHDAVSRAEGEQERLTKEGKEEKLINRARGEFTMWKNMLDAVSSAPSYELVNYATVAAEGTKEYEAVALVQQRAEELVAGIGAVFGVTPSVVNGEELLKFVEPEYIIPYSTISQQINENLVKEGAF